MYDNIYLISIDPGNNTGIAIYELNSATLDIVSITTHVVVLNNYVTNNIDISLDRNLTLYNVCRRLSETYQPHVVAIEAAFMNSRFPKAVMQLSQYTLTVERTFYSDNEFIKLFRYPPKYIKKYIGGGGSADKDGMLEAIRVIPDITNNVDVDIISEHEVDALAIGYITIAELKRRPHMLISY